MHVDHELVEFMPIDEQEYEEVIEEYEEEILVQEGAPEPFGADFADPLPAQGKPRCITPILMITEYISMMCIYVTGILWKPHAWIYLPMSPTSAGRVAAMLRISVAWVTCRY